MSLRKFPKLMFKSLEKLKLNYFRLTVPNMIIKSKSPPLLNSFIDKINENKKHRFGNKESDKNKRDK